MGRNILAALIGYAALFAFVFLTFTIGFAVLGVERSFQAGSFEVSTLWILISLVLSFVCAAAGGFLCRAVTKDDMGIKILAGLALVLGLALASKHMTDERSNETRPADVPVMEAAAKAVQPGWVGFVITLIHVGGVLYGGRLKAGAGK